MKPWNIIQTLNSDNSRLFKESIIRTQAEANNQEFFDGVKLALDSLVTFGIKQVPVSTNSGPGLTWDTFKQTVDQLITRSLTGNAARDAVETLMNTATQDEWNNWYRLILIKDLKCGVSEKTINNVVKKIRPEFQVPVFTVQLAQDSNNHAGKMNGEKLIDSKMDGTRCMTVIYPNGTINHFSRNGKEFVNFPHITEQFESVAKIIDQPLVFDGEMMSKSFQDLMRQLYRKENVNTTDATLYLFDVVPLVDFERGICHIPQVERLDMLHGIFNQLPTQPLNIKLIEQKLIDLDTQEGLAEFREINQFALDNDYEGIMIKDPLAPYECKRSANWLKLKPIISVDLTIVGVEEGTGKNLNRLGALVCEGMDNGKFIQVNVGSGFSDLDREVFWANQDQLIGQIVEVYSDAVTKNQNDTYSLRFPRFSRFRGFQPGEKF